MDGPECNAGEDVQRLLRYGGEAGCLTMVEEYMEIVALDTSVEDIEGEELNGWIQHEMLAATEGYEEWSSKE